MCGTDALVSVVQVSRVAESQWLTTVVFAAAAGAVMLTTVTGPRIQRGPLILPLACVPVVVLDGGRCRYSGW